MHSVARSVARTKATPPAQPHEEKVKEVWATNLKEEVRNMSGAAEAFPVIAIEASELPSPTSPAEDEAATITEQPRMLPAQSFPTAASGQARAEPPSAQMSSALMSSGLVDSSAPIDSPSVAVPMELPTPTSPLGEEATVATVEATMNVPTLMPLPSERQPTVPTVPTRTREAIWSTTMPRRVYRRGPLWQKALKAEADAARWATKSRSEVPPPTSPVESPHERHGREDQDIPLPTSPVTSPAHDEDRPVPVSVQLQSDSADVMESPSEDLPVPTEAEATSSDKLGSSGFSADVMESPSEDLPVPTEDHLPVASTEEQGRDTSVCPSGPSGSSSQATPKELELFCKLMNEDSSDVDAASSGEESTSAGSSGPTSSSSSTDSKEPRVEQPQAQGLLLMTFPEGDSEAPTAVPDSAVDSAFVTSPTEMPKSTKLISPTSIGDQVPILCAKVQHLTDSIIDLQQRLEREADAREKGVLLEKDMKISELERKLKAKSDEARNLKVRQEHLEKQVQHLTERVFALEQLPERKADAREKELTMNELD